MKCSELIFKGTRLLKEKGIAAPHLEAEVLLAFAWGRERTHLLIFSDDEVPREVEDRFHDILCQRSRGVPVAYLTGEKEFMSLGFYVNPDVLIPRPETELLVERVLEYLADFPGEKPAPEPERETKIEVVNPGRGGGRVPEPEPETERPPYFPAACCPTPANSYAGKRTASLSAGEEPGKNSVTTPSGKRTAPLSAGGVVQTPLVADVGTGSGAVAVSLAYYNAQARLVATDISPGALQVAKRNARRHGVTDRVKFLQGDLLIPLLQQVTRGRFSCHPSCHPSGDRLPKWIEGAGTKEVGLDFALDGRLPGEVGELWLGVQARTKEAGLDFPREDQLLEDVQGIGTRASRRRTPAVKKLPQGVEGIGTAVVANLPYIPTADLQSLPLDVQYEPLNALDGGEDGLDHYRRLIPQAAAFLVPKGLLACEVGIGQAELLAELLTKEGWTETEIIKDYAGKERIVTAKRGQA
ncbi:N5-glutamine methyltransferase family protein [Syntrophaceticus schinkii]|jgi:methylase of polypeptide subunit release factors|uniref:Release factor glutamine methyltransferase n=1 Tax=Syntrophaceticus schinkii TaxID=499207 RepID=A0A0B7MF51_9FIRM|nr:HemK/PrmC family methyltransferase [Syntrophaceticus schinkii]CEO88700.1 putative Release factor glutamine methyltransferase [Syntrophaceticus schinkii]